ncbi:MAG: archease [Spirochaetaceae bacterium]
MGYRYPDDGPGGDATIEAWGADLAELIASAWRGALEVMIEDAGELRPIREVPLTIRAENPEELLFAFLDELLFRKDAEGLLLTLDRPEIRAPSSETDRGQPGREEGTAYEARATARGEPIDPARHRLGTDIKAVSFHQFAVKRTAEGWRARIVLDT